MWVPTQMSMFLLLHTFLLCLKTAFLVPYPLCLFKEFARCLIYLSFLEDV